ncbi:MAG TPA: ADP-polyphosphate phosphotransferase [Burkholderiaceae bacterium]|jgi:PPK2 family polyphosphate:nucleotide phosphotransferase|nr:ADP-polyphosphate phosphotransferase [Burkholderiaceae bacterium]
MGKEIDVERFRVRPRARVDLARWPTRVAPAYASKEDYERRLAENRARLAELQEKLYAHDRYALLLIFQAMDAAGKDGAIKHVMSGVNPQGCQVFSFKHPSAEELDHDFLWRAQRALPERGRIGIFNRSYYEEVLIVRVRPEILAAQKLPAVGRDIWQGRFRSIVDAEAHLHRNGTRIVKFFLHVSKEEQRQRLLARIEDPDKQWKFDVADLEQRKAWDRYMAAYEDCLHATSTEHAPWYVVPADDKKNARLIIAQVVIDTLAALKLRYPQLDAAQRRQLAAARRALRAERA